ncbi:2-oxo-4-hydroxy-4-carboxy-5-ureidoimidazoline decarboxylase [Allopusillimonas ginsengisoli]|uniref:2-oxo-4-hydroxy-4-carboxy-5-ureidoimidazoline decarboxylase n=1 Tax=Allopusillimonas ginsengisoli TaxID=453575 RepID=UPI0010226890|nr:2-oxo-4-hydroxy-4-carboxy-5-ureidoimidazoline decarboxylase [Allopusillimonas ginsengisoli]TEA76997.1 2-oxo-4-hydroxy-4-carboxy-5-ureidoimidazoline decarboxylase [Allopusillimonas ginsengisoli]
MTQTQVPDLTLADLSMLPQDDFTDRLADIFEHSPWIARGAWPARPFSDVASLHQAMLDVLAEASEQAKLDLILAHPELAGKEAASGTLTQSSTSEQKGAGLDQCSPEELQRLRALNAAYRERFGFPFVIAVKGLSRYEIMDTIEVRLTHGRDTEFAACLNEIGKIARFRLDALFD